MGKTTSNFRLREAFPGWHSRLAGKCHCSIELERRESKEEKQKAAISSEKRYMLLLTHLFWEVLFAWTSASYSGVFSPRVTWKIYIYLTAYLC